MKMVLSPDLSLNAEYEQYWESFWQDMPEGFVLGENPAEFVVEAIPELESAGIKLVLDVGCGDGRNYGLLRRSGFEVVGVDISPRALSLLKNNIGVGDRPALTCQGRVQALPFQAETIDAIVASDLFNHLIEWATMLDECQRVLKSGGYLICNPLSLRDPLFGRGEWMGHNVFFFQGRLMRFCSEEEIRRSLAQAGLHIERCIEGFREDPPHPKFMDTRHTHVFWTVWARKLKKSAVHDLSF